MPPAKPKRQDQTSKPQSSASGKPVEIVDPRWLIKALALTLIASLICVYGTLCLLVYQGRWQWVLRPSHTVDRTPDNVGLTYAGVRFGASETGQPRLTGWWIPAASDAGLQPKYANLTVLFLHDGSGSLSDTLPALVRLHDVGINVFAIDYRGFGASDASGHPSDTSMAEDAADTLNYLTSTRHIPTRFVVPYGVGLGAALAVELARARSELPAVVLDNPDPDPTATAATAHPSRIIPVRLLLGDQFDIATPIAVLACPKLLIAGDPIFPKAIQSPDRTQTLFQSAASPRFTVNLTSVSKNTDYRVALGRFLDQYLIAQ